MHSGPNVYTFLPTKIAKIVTVLRSIIYKICINDINNDVYSVALFYIQINYHNRSVIKNTMEILV